MEVVWTSSSVGPFWLYDYGLCSVFLISWDILSFLSDRMYGVATSMSHDV